jgi:hypothetical protein
MNRVRPSRERTSGRGIRAQARGAGDKKRTPMLGLAHVVLHVGFCNAIARKSPETTIALRVHMTDKIGRPEVERTYRVERGDEMEAIVEFDSHFGTYALAVDAPAYGCSAMNYLYFIPDHDRSVGLKLSDAPAPPPRPFLLAGTAPQSFLYVQPTFVLFDKAAVACGKPVPQPLDSNIVVENDQDAYYAWFYSSAGGSPEQLTLRLRTPTHQYHYVRIPLSFPTPWGGWPGIIQFNVTQEMVDSLAGESTGTLLCPKLWQTSAG